MRCLDESGETRLAGLQDTSESARPRVCNGPSKVFGSKFLPNSLHFTSKEDPNQGSKYFRFWIQIESRANPRWKKRLFLMTLSRNATHTKQNYCICRYQNSQQSCIGSKLSPSTTRHHVCSKGHTTLHYMRPRHMRAICASLTRSKASEHTAIALAVSSCVWRCILRAPASSSFAL
jgi:hypothetical protein